MEDHDLEFVQKESDLPPYNLYNVSMTDSNDFTQNVAVIASENAIGETPAIDIVMGILMNRQPFMMLRLGMYCAYQFKSGLHVVAVHNKFGELMMVFSIEEQK